VSVTASVPVIGITATATARPVSLRIVTGGAGGDLPDGTFGATQDVVVQEIQAVNR
jgi:hypothetical protein